MIITIAIRLQRKQFRIRLILYILYCTVQYCILGQFYVTQAGCPGSSMISGCTIAAGTNASTSVVLHHTMIFEMLVKQYRYTVHTCHRRLDKSDHIIHYVTSQCCFQTLPNTLVVAHFWRDFASAQLTLVLCVTFLFLSEHPWLRTTPYYCTMKVMVFECQANLALNAPCFRRVILAISRDAPMMDSSKLVPTVACSLLGLMYREHHCQPAVLPPRVWYYGTLQLVPCFMWGGI